MVIEDDFQKQLTSLSVCGDGAPPYSIRQKYKLLDCIGRGNFACVRRAIDKTTGREWACKIIKMHVPGKKVGDGECSSRDIFNEVGYSVFSAGFSQYNNYHEIIIVAVVIVVATVVMYHARNCYNEHMTVHN